MDELHLSADARRRLEEELARVRLCLGSGRVDSDGHRRGAGDPGDRGGAEPAYAGSCHTSGRTLTTSTWKARRGPSYVTTSPGP